MAGKIHWLAIFPGYSVGKRPECFTSSERSAESIAADLRRRLLPDAKTYCQRCHAGQTAAQTEEGEVNLRAEQLGAALGDSLIDRDYGHPSDLRAAGFRMNKSELRTVTYSNTFTATVTVRSFHCLLMIAALIREDNKLDAARKAMKAA